jgi:hypothetical protein
LLHSVSELLPSETLGTSLKADISCGTGFASTTVNIGLTEAFAAAAAFGTSLALVAPAIDGVCR